MKLPAPGRVRWIALAMAVAAAGSASPAATQAALPGSSRPDPTSAARAMAALLERRFEFQPAFRDLRESPAVASQQRSLADLAIPAVPPLPAVPATVAVSAAVAPVPQLEAVSPPLPEALSASRPEVPWAALPDAPPASSLDISPEDTSLPGVAEVADSASPAIPFVAFRRPGRPAPLFPLYVSFAALQVADVASTRRALEAGGREANPVVRGFADNDAAMLAVKAGATVGTIYLAERLWKKNRPAAIVLMTVLNGAYAAIVAHNYKHPEQE